MPLIKVKPLSELPPGTLLELELNQGTYALCNVDGAVHCFEGTCPHAGGPLGQGTLSGNYLVCPWHGYEFDAHTGMNDIEEDLKLQTCSVVIQDGNIFIDLP